MTYRKTPTNSLITTLKREAKKRVTDAVTYTHALDALAVDAGYPDWRTLAMANGQRNAEEGRAFPLDPVLPPHFDNRPHEERPQKELDTWWNKPFIVSNGRGGYEVRCLCSGAWDRSTWWGTAETLEAADDCARTKLAEWLKVMATPAAVMRADGLVDLIVMHQKPGTESKTLHSGLTHAQAHQILKTFEE